MIELRWLEKWVPDPEYDGSIATRQCVLQFREAENPQHEQEIHGPIWSLWRDVPVEIDR